MSTPVTCNKPTVIVTNTLPPYYHNDISMLLPSSHHVTTMLPPRHYHVTTTSPACTRLVQLDKERVASRREERQAFVASGCRHYHVSYHHISHFIWWVQVQIKTGASEKLLSKTYAKVPYKYIFQKKINADILNSYAHWRILNNIFNLVTFLNSKMTSPFDWNEAARLTNLTKVWQD